MLDKLTTVDGQGSGVDADLLDGQDSSEFVDVTGDTMTGNLNAPGFELTSPVTRYHAVPPASWTASSSVTLVQTSVTIKYIDSGGTTMFAPVHVPHLATVTELSCRLRDLSALHSVAVQLIRANIAIAEVSTTGPEAPNFVVRTDDTIDTSLISNVISNIDLRLQLQFTVDDPACGSACAVATCWIEYEIDNPYP